MKANLYTVLILLLCLLLAVVLAGCGSIQSYAYADPRCQPRQYCPYTDAPAPVRTEALRSNSVQ